MADVTAADSLNSWSDSILTSYPTVVTQVATEVLTRRGANAINVTSVALEVLIRLQPNTDETADDSLSFNDATTLQFDIFLLLGDDLNNWSDGFSNNFSEGVYLSDSDTLELSDSPETETSDKYSSADDTLELSDSSACGFVELYVASILGLDVMYFYDWTKVDFFAPATPLSKTASDTMYEGKNKRAIGLRDSMNWELVAHMQEEALWNAEEDIFIIDDDTSLQLGFLNDAPTAEDSSDSWDDAVEEVLGVPESYDSNMYNWDDGVALTPGDAVFANEDYLEFSDEVSTSANTVWLTASGADTLSFSDAISAKGAILERAGDFLSLNDRVELKYAVARTGADLLIFTDILQVLLGLYDPTPEDTLDLSDAATLSLSVYLGSTTAADSFSLSDTVSVLKSTSDVNYLRRYLNDVARG